MFATYIQPLVAEYGCWAVFFVVMFEATGLPLPGESALVLAGVYAGATGNIAITNVILAAASGAIIGDNFGFWIGRRFGTRLLERFGKYVGLTNNRLLLGHYLFAHHGGKIVFFGRFIAFLRVFAALLAGSNRYRWQSFLFYNAAGGTTWACVVSLSAYVFGDVITKVSGIVGLAGLAVAIMGMLAFFWVFNRQEKKFEARLLARVLREQKQAPALDALE